MEPLHRRLGGRATRVLDAINVDARDGRSSQIVPPGFFPQMGGEISSVAPSPGPPLLMATSGFWVSLETVRDSSVSRECLCGDSFSRLFLAQSLPTVLDPRRMHRSPNRGPRGELKCPEWPTVSAVGPMEGEHQEADLS